MVAYRLQADALGDLDAATLRLLKRVGSARSDAEVAPLTDAFDQRRRELLPGTVLTREWNGHIHRVMVTKDGFAWEGSTYDSLSKIACAITGTKWNGPRFFGLRDKRPDRGEAMTAASKAVRCAIYTRVSTDSGLDQEFNSLDAQYDAASAYIRSQAHAHWTLVRTRYDDGGFSGGSTDRPALQQPAGRHHSAQGQCHRGLQGRPADAVAGGLCQAC